MGTQLNIKSAEARALAEQLAELKGESITGAVIAALHREVSIMLHARSTAEERAHEKERGFYDLVCGSRSLWKGAALSIDHGDLLYDEYGLSR